MAITPESAGKITEKEITSVAQAEREIDSILAQRYQGDHPVSVSTPLLGLNSRCVKELLRRYEAAGWNVKKKSDGGDIREQRTPQDYWSFSAEPRFSTVTRWEDSSRGHNYQDQGCPPPWADAKRR